MALEMKKCKECGKLFTPKSKLSQYCDDLHYRPCPVCGKLVEAKYLSDPARCCSKECSQKKKEADKQKAKQTASMSVNDSMKKQNANPLHVHAQVPKDREGKGGVRTLFALPQEQHLVADDIIPMPRPETAVIKLPQKSADTEHAKSLRSNYPVRTYVGTPILGFIPGHEYALDIDKDDRNILYIVTAIYNFTEGEDSNLVMNLSSQISINQNFAQI